MQYKLIQYSDEVFIKTWNTWSYMKVCEAMKLLNQLSTKRAINSGKQKLFYDREYFQSCETIYMASMFLGFDQNPLMTLSRPFEEFSGTSKLQHT